MKIERIQVNNFCALRDVRLRDLPSLAVFIGENGTGKSTLFKVFAFLQDALKNNVSIALQRMGGYKEVASRGHENEPILITIFFNMEVSKENKYVCYYLEITNDNGIPIVAKEAMLTPGNLTTGNNDFAFLVFMHGKGMIYGDEKFPKTPLELESPSTLALKGAGQFKQFKEVFAFRSFIENWHLSDFHINEARQRSKAGIAEHLSVTGDNLPLVAQYLHDNKPDIFRDIVEQFRQRIPGMSDVELRKTEDGHLFLRFRDGQFKNPFIARHVSDGTIKMFAYLVLLYDPNPHPFLCIEEPENQLYPELMGILAEEMRDYARRGGQVFVSTHSPDFMNNVEVEEGFLMKKKDGETTIHRMQDDEQIVAFVEGGDKLGYMWRHDMLGDLS